MTNTAKDRYKVVNGQRQMQNQSPQNCCWGQRYANPL